MTGSPNPLIVCRRPDLQAMQTRALRARRGPAQPREPRRIGLWLPTGAIFVLLAPFALLVLPFLYLVPRRRLPDPGMVIWTLGRLFLSLGGTSVEIDSPRAQVRIHLF